MSDFERYVDFVHETCACCGKPRKDCLPARFDFSMWVDWGKP